MVLGSMARFGLHHSRRWRGLLVETFAGWWEDRAPRPGSAAWYAILRKRLLSFAMVVGICFLLLVSLLASAALSSLRHFADRQVQGLATTWTVLGTLASVVVSTLIFAMIYKILPDV